MEYADSQREEMELALKQNRQPKCTYCDKPLDRIVQSQSETIVWEWNGKLKKYLKQDSDGDSDPPCHSGCWAYDWGFVDEQLVSY